MDDNNNQEVEDSPNEDDVSLNEDPQDKNELPQDEEPVENILSESTISNCISMLCKTSDGVNYAYVQLYCIKKSLTDVSILSRYHHLRYVDLSHNEISDISPLQSLRDLLVLDCSYNRIERIMSIDLPYLRRLNISNNRLKRLDTVAFSQLEILNLSGNKITDLYNEANEVCLRSDLLPCLQTLELRGNLLVGTEGLSELHTVNTIYLSQNKITTVSGLTKLRKLQSLHLRDNQIENLDGFCGDLQSLQYLNLRGNRVDDLSEVKKLQDLCLLRALILSGNPIAEKDEYRLETLTALRKLVRLDKDNFLDEERTEAEQIHEQRLQDDLTEREKSNAEEDAAED